MNIRSIYNSIYQTVLSIIYYSKSPLKLFDSRTRRSSPDTASRRGSHKTASRRGPPYAASGRGSHDTASRRGSPKTASRRCFPETALCDDFTCYLWQVDGYSRFSLSKK